MQNADVYFKARVDSRFMVFFSTDRDTRRKVEASVLKEGMHALNTESLSDMIQERRNNRTKEEYANFVIWFFQQAISSCNVLITHWDLTLPQFNTARDLLVRLGAAFVDIDQAKHGAMGIAVLGSVAGKTAICETLGCKTKIRVAANGYLASNRPMIDNAISSFNNVAREAIMKKATKGMVHIVTSLGGIGDWLKHSAQDGIAPDGLRFYNCDEPSFSIKPKFPYRSDHADDALWIDRPTWSRDNLWWDSLNKRWEQRGYHTNRLQWVEQMPNPALRRDREYLEVPPAILGLTLAHAVKRHPMWPNIAVFVPDNDFVQDMMGTLISMIKLGIMVVLRADKPDQLLKFYTDENRKVKPIPGVSKIPFMKVTLDQGIPQPGDESSVGGAIILSMNDQDRIIMRSSRDGEMFSSTCRFRDIVTKATPNATCSVRINCDWKVSDLDLRNVVSMNHALSRVVDDYRPESIHRLDSVILSCLSKYHDDIPQMHPGDTLIVSEEAFVHSVEKFHSRDGWNKSSKGNLKARPLDYVRAARGAEVSFIICAPTLRSTETVSTVEDNFDFHGVPLKLFSYGVSSRDLMVHKVESALLIDFIIDNLPNAASRPEVQSWLKKKYRVTVLTEDRGPRLQTVAEPLSLPSKGYGMWLNIEYGTVAYLSRAVRGRFIKWFHESGMMKELFPSIIDFTFTGNMKREGILTFMFNDQRLESDVTISGHLINMIYGSDRDVVNIFGYLNQIEDNVMRSDPSKKPKVPPKSFELPTYGKDVSWHSYWDYVFACLYWLSVTVYRGSSSRGIKGFRRIPNSATIALYCLARMNAIREKYPYFVALQSSMRKDRKLSEPLEFKTVI